MGHAHMPYVYCTSIESNVEFASLTCWHSTRYEWCAHNSNNMYPWANRLDCVTIWLGKGYHVSHMGTWCS